MELKLDVTKEYGLVLEGGGARGAYQIGAWRALKEAGIRIKGVSGTSVGALNGALICMGDLEQAEEVWENIRYSQVMSVEDEWMDGIIKRDFKNLSAGEVLKNSLRYLANGGIDVTPLRDLITSHIKEEKIRSREVEFFFQIFSVSGMKELDVDACEIPEGEIADMVLASAYFPVFKKEKINGKRLIDAGMINNVPVDALVNRGYENIISIRIYGIGLARKVKLPEQVTVTEIAPRVGLGSILEFDSKKSRRNMMIGYYDAMRVLYGLEGTIYYIDSRMTEEDALKAFLMPVAESRLLLEFYGLEKEEEASPYRDIVERLLPAAASELKLSKDWNYHQLYLAMLEASAKLMRVQKYHIYTEQELLAVVREKWELLEEVKREEMPRFVSYMAVTGCA